MVQDCSQLKADFDLGSSMAHSSAVWRLSMVQNGS